MSKLQGFVRLSEQSIKWKVMDYSEDGVALGANVLTQNLEVGVPGTGDLSQMAQGTYDPKGDMGCAPPVYSKVSAMKFRMPSLPSLK